MTPIEDLTKPLTVDQVRLSIYSVLAQIGVDTTTWKPGGAVRTLIAGTSIMLSALSRLTAEISKSGFLELASGGWLSLLASNVYGVDRFEAVFATGSAALANSSGGIYSLADGELQITNGRTGATYVNVGPITIPSVSSGIVCSLRATEAGSGSTAPITDAMIVASPLPGVTCGLTSAMIGQDEESDPALRLRCLESLGARSPNGPPDAYGFVCRSAVRADGSPIGITRIALTKDGFGGVDVYVAGPSGPIEPTDLDVVRDAVLAKAAPQGVTARVHNATAVTVHVGGVAYSYDPSLTADVVSGRLTAFFAAQPIGGNKVGSLGAIYQSAIIAAIGKTARVDLVTPSADVQLGANQVAVLAPSGVSVVLLASPSTVVP
jgi:phage-related baseplate assembly protein